MAVLALPDVRQKGDHDCGLAAVLCVLRYLGVRRSREELELLLGSTRLDGTDPRAVEARFRCEGLAVQAGTMDEYDLGHHARRGRPVVCLVSRGGVGHYVVSAGCRYGLVHYHDPACGPTRERLPRFVEQWSDWDRHGGEWRRFGVAVSRFG